MYRVLLVQKTAPVQQAASHIYTQPSQIGEQKNMVNMGQQKQRFLTDARSTGAFAADFTGGTSSDAVG